jgi:signal transduction histidine kinase
MLIKVFYNLIDNTLRHGEKATEFRLSHAEEKEGLKIIYEDDGVGIAGERKKDLFVRGVGSATGFSLFFVHDILEISDMTIHETGVPGEGVRFEISVPRGLYRIAGKDRNNHP